jgi:hypothetical protein
VNQAQQVKLKLSVVSTIIQGANAVFVIIAVFVPIGALVYALNFGPIVALKYVHIMSGAMWTGIALFMGFVLAQVVGVMDPISRAGIFMSHYFIYRR